MIRREDQVIDEYDRAVEGASIYVFDIDGSEATLTSDGVTPLDQPVTTDEFGTYAYYADEHLYREDVYYGGKLRNKALVAVGSPPEIKGDPGSPGEGWATRAALKAAAATATNGDDFYLTEAGREGKFIFRTGDFSGHVAADTAEGIYIKADTIASSAGALIRQNDMMWRLEWFGAVAGNADLTQEAAERISALADFLGFLHVEGNPGVEYLFGRQASNSLDIEGQGPWYLADVSPFTAVDLASVIIKMNGATFKFRDGLKYGGFNATTGLPEDANGLASKRAHPGFFLHAIRCERVHVDGKGGFMDGNSPNLVLGGYSAAPAYFEGRHAPIKLNSCSRVVVENVSGRNWLLDGPIYTWASAGGLTTSSDPKPALFLNVAFDLIGRSCLSILGGNQVTVVNCALTRAGGAQVTGGGTRGTPPATCCDIESESGVIRNVRFINTRFSAGPNGTFALCSESGDVENVIVDGCVLVGTVELFKPRCSIHNSRIYGALYRPYGNTDPALALNIVNCQISDSTMGDTPLSSGAFGNPYVIYTQDFAGVVVRNTTINAARLRVNLANAKTQDVTVNISIGTTDLADNSTIGSLAGGEHRRLRFIENITANIPATGYYVDPGTTAVMENSEIVSAGGKLKWISQGAAGFVGKYDNVFGTPLGTAVNGDVAVTLRPRSSKRVQIFNTPLTANRTITHDTTNAADGDTFRVVRTAAATGAFNLVGPGKNLTAASQIMEHTYKGGVGWELTLYAPL